MLPTQNLNLMKLYASIHGVCGLAEGYSDTTAAFFKTLDEAKAHKAKILELLMKEEVEAIESNRGFSGGLVVESLSDGTQDIITMNEDECEQQILKIVELSPIWDTGRDADNVTTEWFCWNQMDNEAVYGGESFKDWYLPTDMGLIMESMEWLGKDSTIDLEMYQEFVSGVYFRSQTFIDADDVVIHCFRLPKFNGGMTTNTKQREVTISQDNDFNEIHEQHKQFAK